MRLLGLLREAAAAASLLLFLALATSGWALMASYVPSSAEAFDAVLFLRREGGLGGFLRSLHHHASSGLVVSGALYLLATFLEGRLHAERRAWWAAGALFGLALGSCFTGFLLPMDQNAYWGTLVRLGIVETVPVAGPQVAEVLRGGGSVNASTLPRFYALHVSLLPFLALVVAFFLLGEARDALADGPRRRRALAAAFLVLVLLYGLAAAVRAPLEPRARTADTGYVPRPEWYFLWLFQLGKYVEGLEWVRSLAVPAVGLGLAAFLPFLPPGTLRQRGAAAAGLGLLLSGLTALSRHDDRALPAKPSYEDGLAVRAREIFTNECRDCHGDEGRGDGPQARSFSLATPDFTDPEFWTDAPVSRLRQSIREGRGDDMPAFGKKLTAEEIEAVLALVQDRFRPPPGPGAPTGGTTNP